MTSGSPQDSTVGGGACFFEAKSKFETDGPALQWLQLQADETAYSHISRLLLRSNKRRLRRASDRPLPPDGIDGRIDEQFEQERSEDPADHRGRDPLHHFRAGACAPENRQ